MRRELVMSKKFKKSLGIHELNMYIKHSRCHTLGTPTFQVILS